MSTICLPSYDFTLLRHFSTWFDSFRTISNFLRIILHSARNNHNQHVISSNDNNANKRINTSHFVCSTCCQCHRTMPSKKREREREQKEIEKEEEEDEEKEHSVPQDTKYQ